MLGERGRRGGGGAEEGGGRERGYIGGREQMGVSRTGSYSLV